MPIPQLRIRQFVPRRTGDASPLGELESAIMKMVWASSDKVSVAHVHKVLLSAQPSDGGAAYTTIKTTMERLVDKGILTQVRQGKAYLYEATLTREELERRIVAQALSNLVREFPSAVASFFAHPVPGVSEERLRILTEAIENVKKHEEEGEEEGDA